MMRKVAIIGISAAALVVLLLSFGMSNTGLFHLSEDFGDEDVEDEEIPSSQINEEKWKVVGKVNVTSGKTSKL